MHTIFRCAIAALAIATVSAATDDALAWHQWRIVPSAWCKLLSGGAPTCTFGGNGFSTNDSTPIPNGIRFQGRVGDQTITHDLTQVGGVLTSRWSGVDESGNRHGVEVMIGFEGADLANRSITMDGQKLDIPAEFKQHQSPEARTYVLFADQPGRIMTIQFTQCRSADLRDFRDHTRWPTRNDLQLFAVPNEDGVVEFTIDLRKSDTDSGESKDKSDSE